jgi:hypothetical protein
MIGLFILKIEEELLLTQLMVRSDIIIKTLYFIVFFLIVYRLI